MLSGRRTDDASRLQSDLSTAFVWFEAASVECGRLTSQRAVGEQLSTVSSVLTLTCVRETSLNILPASTQLKVYNGRRCNISVDVQRMYYM